MAFTPRNPLGTFTLQLCLAGCLTRDLSVTGVDEGSYQHLLVLGTPELRDARQQMKRCGHVEKM
jgi:hypothetical protein